MNVKDVKDIQGVLDYADFLKGDLMNENRQHMDGASFKTADGQTQIDVSASIYEPGYEYFDTTVNIRENGHDLFKQDASNVGPYHNESYTQSQFRTLDEAKEYLKDKFADVEFAPTKDQPVPKVFNEFPIKWDDPAYAASLNPPTRLVFEDQGAVQTKEGETFHKVAFAYACDRKTFGRDESLANPYLVNRKEGKEISHAVLLPDSMYNGLMGMANHEGTERSRWTGVIQADVVPMKDGSLTANLTDEAIRNKRVKTPVKAFDEAEHNSFVKQSLQEVYKNQKPKEKNEKQDAVDIVKPGDLTKEQPAPVKPNPVKLTKEEEQYKVVSDVAVKPAPEPEAKVAAKPLVLQRQHAPTRLLYEDQGTVQSKSGETFHKVTFALACDQKQPGIDRPVANPYLVNRGKDDPQGSHSVLLSEERYQRLQQATNDIGMENSRWAGVFEAPLVRSQSKGHLVPDLSQGAEDSGRLRVPSEPFDEAKHDSFVKQSLLQMTKYGPASPGSRIHGEPQSGRRLPDVGPDVSVSDELVLDK